MRFPFLIQLLVCSSLLAFGQNHDYQIILPPPTGIHQVGTHTFYLTDTSREELATSAPEDFRELIIQVWYPAKKNEKQYLRPILNIWKTIKVFGMNQLSTKSSV